MYLEKSIKEINELLKNQEIKPIDLVEEAFKRIEADKDLNAYITLNKEEALKQAKELEGKEVDNLLFGIPIAIKDNILTKDLRTTAASHILDNFIPIYDATVVEKIKTHNMIIVGKTNMDEFAMGSSSRTSYFGAPKNPWNNNKISGGSSGGSATTIAARHVPFALGSDTGGSIRQPASYTGIVGMKPTYGRVSRYGVIAFASSLDQLGPMTQNVLNNALLLNVISGHDPHDMTSSHREVEDYTRLIGKDIKGKKIAVPRFLMSDIVDPEIIKTIEGVIEMLKENGATVDYIDMKYLDNAVTLYQIIAMGEASSNLARFDGIRYGLSHKDPKSHEDLYLETRREGFGKEVKRRIIFGTYVLSSGYYDAYYKKAQQVRTLVMNEFNKAFEKYDVILTPTSPTVAFDIGSKSDNPLEMYLADICTVSVNIAGLPGISVPCGVDSQGMPIGMQLIGNKFQEETILNAAYTYEQATKFREKYKPEI